MTSRPSTLRLVAVAGLALITPACGGPPEGRVSVSPTAGTVTYEGRPLPGAFLLFRKTEVDPKVPSPTAITGEDGTFALTTYEREDGAPPGEYVVSISTAPRTVEKKVSLKKVERPIDLLTGRYADPKTSGLKATIQPGSNTLPPFDLTATGGAEPASVPTGRRDR